MGSLRKETTTTTVSMMEIQHAGDATGLLDTKCVPYQVGVATPYLDSDTLICIDSNNLYIDSDNTYIGSDNLCVNSQNSYEDSDKLYVGSDNPYADSDNP